jgi:hypothetical protein
MNLLHRDDRKREFPIGEDVARTLSMLFAFSTHMIKEYGLPHPLRAVTYH